MSLPWTGVVRYDEGIHIGYRAWLKSGVEPAYEFGYGLGYTTWDFGDLTLSADTLSQGGSVDATVQMTNTGDRTGKQVIQIYASRPDSAIDRPARWLVGFAVARAAAGETTTATVQIPARAFADWSQDGGGWHYEAGAFTLQAGTSVSDLPLSAIVTVA